MILGVKFLISRVPAADVPDGSIACADAVKRLITLPNDQGDDLIAECYWHEIVHMSLCVAGVESMLKEDQDEAIAQALGVALSRHPILRAIALKEKNIKV